MNNSSFTNVMSRVLGVAMLAFGVLQAYGAGPEGGESALSGVDAPGKVTIAAERMEMLLGEVIKLDGDVLVEDSRYTLTCEHGLIFLRPKDDADGQSGHSGSDGQSLGNGAVLDRIEASGRVMVRTHDGTQSATGDRARYDKEAERITLEGNCTILADGRVMRTARVVYDVKAGTITASRTSITIPLSGGGGKGDGGLGGIFGGVLSKEANQDSDAGAKEHK